MPNLPWSHRFPAPASLPPLRTLLRSTAYRLSPPRAVPFVPVLDRRQREVIRSGAATPRQRSRLLREERPGLIPTIILGGFVPEPQDATYLQRSLFLRHGTSYYVVYNRSGFSADLLYAQLDDLVEELADHHAAPPVIFGISFGGGLLIDWLRRHAAAGQHPAISAVVLVSPVACFDDILEPGATKASTLLGRVIHAFTQIGEREDAELAWVQKSRQVMVKMFESGAQNREALKLVLTRPEVERIRQGVMDSLRNTDRAAARERISVLQHFQPLPSIPATALPLAEVPALVLFSEKESSVMVENAPTRIALESDLRTYFPLGTFNVVSNPGGGAVQHASLLFHYFNYQPHLSLFYRRLRQQLPPAQRFRHTVTRLLKPAHDAHRRRAEATARAACGTASATV